MGGAVLFLLVNLDHSPLVSALVPPRVQGCKSWGVGICIIISIHFLVFGFGANKFRLTRMSSLVLAGQPRSLPSSERPRASSGTGVQELGGGDMYHYFYSFFGFWFRCKIKFD